MDPKLSQLDPKLREAYDRVMNGPSTPPSPANNPAGSMPQQHNPLPVTPAANTPTPPQTPVSPAPSSIPNPVPPAPHLNLDEVTLPNNPNPVIPGVNPAPITPPPAFNASATVPNPAPIGNSTISFNAKDAGKNQGMSGTKKKKSMLPVIIGVAIPILLVVYTVVWVIIFDLKLPFLSQ